MCHRLRVEYPLTSHRHCLWKGEGLSAVFWGKAEPVDSMEHLAETQDQSVTSEGWGDAKLPRSFKQAERVSRLGLSPPPGPSAAEGVGMAGNTVKRRTEVFPFSHWRQEPPGLWIVSLSCHPENTIVPFLH